MFEAIAHWYLQRQQEKRDYAEAKMHRNMAVATPVPMGGLRQLAHDPYGTPKQTRTRNMMVRVVAIRNGFLVGTDEDPFESLDFCKDAEEVAQAVVKTAACSIMEK